MNAPDSTPPPSTNPHPSTSFHSHLPSTLTQSEWHVYFPIGEVHGGIACQSSGRERGDLRPDLLLCRKRWWGLLLLDSLLLSKDKQRECLERCSVSSGNIFLIKGHISMSYDFLFSDRSYIILNCISKSTLTIDSKLSLRLWLINLVWR